MNPQSTTPGSQMPSFPNFTDQEYQDLAVFLEASGTGGRHRASLRAAVRVFLGITGASGAPYAARLLRPSSEAGCEVGVCISDAGHEVLATELYGDPSLPRDEVVARLTAGLAGVVVYGKDDYSSPYASGSARVDAYVDLPVLDGDRRVDRSRRDGEPRAPRRLGRAQGGA